MECMQLLLNATVNINSPLDGAHAQTSLKSAHFYLSDNILKPALQIYYYHCLSKGDKSLILVQIHTCDSMQQSRHHMQSSTDLVKLLEHGLFHVQEIPLQIPDKANVLNLIHSSKFQAIKVCGWEVDMRHFFF